MKRANFVHVEFHADRLKRSALFLSVLFYALLWLGAVVNHCGLKKYDAEVWRENQALVWRVNRLDVLASRSCIGVARKPAERGPT